MGEIKQAGAAVLIVDDEPSILATCAAWINSAGRETICARSASEALTMARSMNVSIALVDYRLQGEAQGIVLGSAMLHAFGIPFVLISGFLTPEVVVRAMKAGASDVLAKPLEQTTVAVAVDQALSNRHIGRGPKSGRHVTSVRRWARCPHCLQPFVGRGLLWQPVKPIATPVP